MFSNSQDGAFNALFCPQPKVICLTVTEEKKKQEIFTFKKVKSANFYPNPTICSKRFLKLISDYQNNWQMNVIADR